MNNQTFIFICETNYEEQPKTTLRLETDAVALDEIIQKFEDFLRGAGFIFDGHLTNEYSR